MELQEPQQDVLIEKSVDPQAFPDSGPYQGTQTEETPDRLNRLSQILRVLCL